MDVPNRSDMKTLLGVTVALLNSWRIPETLGYDGNLGHGCDGRRGYSFSGLPLGEYTVASLDRRPVLWRAPSLLRPTPAHKTIADVTIKAETGSAIDVNFGFAGRLCWRLHLDIVNRDGLQDADLFRSRA